MDFKKIKYSKCPNCGEHGIPLLKSSKNHNLKLICKHCGSRYKVNRALTITVELAAAFFVAIPLRLILKKLLIPQDNLIFPVICLAFLVIYIAFQYFAPLEELDEEWSYYIGD